MTWSDFYQLCFLVGLSLSALSLVAGATHFHLPFKMHLPFHGHAGTGHGGAQLSWFNASTAMAFLAWFGGTGYILTKHSHFVAIVSLGFATVAGLFAGLVVFNFMTRLVKATDARLLEWDYRMEGAIGTISAPIRENGTGELIFEQNGVRKSVGARCGDGSALPKGTEVVIERFDGGIAYVKKWEEFTR